LGSLVRLEQLVNLDPLDREVNLGQLVLRVMPVRQAKQVREVSQDLQEFQVLRVQRDR